MTTHQPTSFRPSPDALATLSRKAKAWGLKRTAFIVLAIKMMPDEPPQHGEKKDDER